MWRLALVRLQSTRVYIICFGICAVLVSNVSILFHLLISLLVSYYITIITRYSIFLHHFPSHIPGCTILSTDAVLTFKIPWSRFLPYVYAALALHQNPDIWLFSVGRRASWYWKSRCPYVNYTPHPPTPTPPPRLHWTKWPPFWKTKIWNAFSWMKMIELWFKFHWNSFPGVQLTIIQHWFR